MCKVSASTTKHQTPALGSCHCVQAVVSDDSSGQVGGAEGQLDVAQLRKGVWFQPGPCKRLVHGMNCLVGWCVVVLCGWGGLVGWVGGWVLEMNDWLTDMLVCVGWFCGWVSAWVAGWGGWVGW